MTVQQQKLRKQNRPAVSESREDPIEASPNPKEEIAHEISVVDSQ